MDTVTGHSIYIVQSGDTLSGLFGSDWQAVAEYNNITDPNLIYIGQEIRFPSHSTNENEEK